jgi:hypothetical protein
MNLIIGLGSGRCGTMSLSHLLSGQKNTFVTHEVPLNMSWKFDPSRINNKLNAWDNQQFTRVGDVASYYLPYVPYINSKVDNVKFVCLKRDKTETSHSWVSKLEGSPAKNNFREWDGTFRTVPFYISFPKYRTDSLFEAADLYWEEYYNQAEKLEREMDNFKIFNTEDLNTLKGVKQILTFSGIKNHTPLIGIQKNLAPKSGGFIPPTSV